MLAHIVRGNTFKRPPARRWPLFEYIQWSIYVIIAETFTYIADFQQKAFEV
jgi:hypothetical protein